MLALMGGLLEIKSNSNLFDTAVRLMSDTNLAESDRQGEEPETTRANGTAAGRVGHGKKLADTAYRRSIPDSARHGRISPAPGSYRRRPGLRRDRGAGPAERPARCRLSL